MALDVECCYAECSDLGTIMLNVIMLNVVILSVVMLNVVVPFITAVSRWVEGVEVVFKINTSGLYYKHVTIVNNNSSIVSKWSFKLTDDPRVVINDRNRFMIQKTDGESLLKRFFFLVVKQISLGPRHSA
jgi:hypothetical protein